MLSQQQEAARVAGENRTREATERLEAAMDYFLATGEPFDQKDVLAKAGLSAHFLANHPNLRAWVNECARASGGGVPGKKTPR